MLNVLAIDNFPIPGDAGWKLAAVIPPSENRKDKGLPLLITPQLRSELMIDIYIYVHLYH